jgi:hypothetical protein
MGKSRMKIARDWWDSTGRHQARLVPEVRTQYRMFSSHGVHDIAVFTRNVHSDFLLKSGILNGIEWRYLSHKEKYSVVGWYETLAKKN